MELEATEQTNHSAAMRALRAGLAGAVLLSAILLPAAAQAEVLTTHVVGTHTVQTHPANQESAPAEPAPDPSPPATPAAEPPPNESTTESGLSRCPTTGCGGGGGSGSGGGGNGGGSGGGNGGGNGGGSGGSGDLDSTPQDGGHASPNANPNDPELLEWAKKGPHLCPDGQPTLWDDAMGTVFGAIDDALIHNYSAAIINGGDGYNPLEDPAEVEVGEAEDFYGGLAQSYRSCFTTEVR